MTVAFIHMVTVAVLISIFPTGEKPCKCAVCLSLIDTSRSGRLTSGSEALIGGYPK